MSISTNLLAPADYQVSRFKTRNVKKGIESFQEKLAELAPTFVDAIIDGYQLVGKTNGYQQYIGIKDGEYFTVNISKRKGVTIKKEKEITKDLSTMNIQTKKLRDVKFNPNLFIPMKSGTALDYCFSTEGGIMPATNYIFIGDPGIGKSSLCIQYQADILKQNPGKKILFLSAEMTVYDMIPYTERFPLWKDLDILFIPELTEGLYKESIETKINEGFDLIVMDSFAELADSVRGDYNEGVAGKNKKSYNDIEKWLVDLMVKQNSAENTEGVNTSFICIQQMTKGGDFVGSNKLKHNTTGMIELRYTKSGERKVVVSKNRRGFDYDNLYFKFSSDTNEPIEYDVARILRDKAVQLEIQKVGSAQMESEQETEAWFNTLGTTDKHKDSETDFDLPLELQNTAN